MATFCLPSTQRKRDALIQGTNRMQTRLNGITKTGRANMENLMVLKDACKYQHKALEPFIKDITKKSGSRDFLILMSNSLYDVHKLIGKFDNSNQSKNKLLAAMDKLVEALKAAGNTTNATFKGNSGAVLNDKNVRAKLLTAANTIELIRKGYETYLNTENFKSKAADLKVFKDLHDNLKRLGSINEENGDEIIDLFYKFDRHLERLIKANTFFKPLTGLRKCIKALVNYGTQCEGYYTIYHLTYFLSDIESCCRCTHLEHIANVFEPLIVKLGRVIRRMF